MQSEAMIRKAAEAIWAIRREKEDRCDMSLDDIGGEESSVWQEAKAALEAVLLTDEMIEAAKAEYAECEFLTDEQVDASIKRIVRAALEAALSAAEPWPFERQNYNCPCIHPSQCDESCVKKPAPSVAVKALEWEYAERAVGTYIARDERGDMYWINQSFGSDSYYFTTVRRFDGETLYDADDLEAAKAAAQADYEARIRSALSAQAQDVAGWQPIESATEESSEPYICYSPGNPRAQNEYARDPHYHIDGFSERWPRGRNQYPESPYTHWMPLPAAPAKQEGKP